MEKQANEQTGLPENAFRELKEGEQYTPPMSPDKTYKEVTAWSVLWGILMAVLFSAASAYLGLKVGQVFEAAIPSVPGLQLPVPRVVRAQKSIRVRDPP